MPEREHAFLHTLQRNAQGGSVSSPQAKLRHELGACARILSGIFPRAFILTFHRVIPMWFLVFLFLGVIVAAASCSPWFLFAL